MSKSEAFVVFLLTATVTVQAYLARRPAVAVGLLFLVFKTLLLSSESITLTVTTLPLSLFTVMRNTQSFGPAFIALALTSVPHRYAAKALGVASIGALLMALTVSTTPWLCRACWHVGLGGFFHMVALLRVEHAAMREEAHLVSSLLPVLLVEAYPPGPTGESSEIVAVATAFFGASVMACAVCALLRGTMAGLLLGAIVVASHYIYATMQLTPRHQRDPGLLLFEFTVSHQGVVACLAVAVLAGVTAGPPANLPKIIQRKYFHYLATFMFTPVLLWDPQVLQVAFPIALGLLCLLEMLRLSTAAPRSIRGALTTFLSRFADERDQGVIRTHVYLLLGCAAPMMLRMSDVFSGVAILGVGDSTAACLGTFFGRHKWGNVWGFRGRLPLMCARRSVEGTLGAMASIALYYRCVGYLHPTTDSAVSRVPILVVIGGSLAEVFVSGVDNLVLPVFVMALGSCGRS